MTGYSGLQSVVVTSALDIGDAVVITLGTVGCVGGSVVVGSFGGSVSVVFGGVGPFVPALVPEDELHRRGFRTAKPAITAKTTITIATFWGVMRDDASGVSMSSVSMSLSTSGDRLCEDGRRLLLLLRLRRGPRGTDLVTAMVLSVNEDISYGYQVI
jgi:hypothetical protein